MQYISGVYRGDRLQGKGKIEWENGNLLYGWYVSRSLIVKKEAPHSI